MVGACGENAGWMRGCILFLEPHLPPRLLAISGATLEHKEAAGFHGDDDTMNSRVWYSTAEALAISRNPTLGI